MKRLQPIIAFLLLTLFLVPVVSTFVLQLQQLYVQNQMEEALEKEQLVTLRIKTTSIQWVHKNKECFIDGELFDVKEIKQEGNEIILTGLFDVQEKAITEAIAKQSKKENNNPSKQIIKLLLQVVIQVNESSNEILSSAAATNNQLYKPAFYLAPYHGIQTPPPKNI
jgi:hypothetical protein